MEPTIATLASIVVTVGGITFFLLGIRLNMVNEVSKRLQEYVEEFQDTPESFPLTVSTRKVELSGNFRSRVLVPWLVKITDFFGRITPGKLSKDLENQLAVAGNPMGLTPKGFYSIRIGSVLLGVVIAIFFLRSSFVPTEPTLGMIPIPVTGSGTELQSATSPNVFRAVLYSALALIIFTNLPKTWLRRKVRIRKTEIIKSLPDALDMLSVCADAGLGFDQSVQRVSEHWDTALSNEFRRVVAEMGMGLARAKTLRNMAERVNVPQLSSFVAVIIQSDQLGMSITQTLHAQAKQMRIERRFRAQEQARKMPLKMLFPLMLFIFPSMFAVILGPMVPVLSEMFDSMIKNATLG
jgi:tight adherence protein C